MTDRLPAWARSALGFTVLLTMSLLFFAALFAPGESMSSLRALVEVPVGP